MTESEPGIFCAFSARRRAVTITTEGSMSSAGWAALLSLRVCSGLAALVWASAVVGRHVDASSTALSRPKSCPCIVVAPSLCSRVT
jgi:hypothetical protein